MPVMVDRQLLKVKDRPHLCELLRSAGWKDTHIVRGTGMGAGTNLKSIKTCSLPSLSKYWGPSTVAREQYDSFSTAHLLD